MSKLHNQAMKKLNTLIFTALLILTATIPQQSFAAPAKYRTRAKAIKKIFRTIKRKYTARLIVENYPNQVLINAPFVYQASGGSMADPRLADGCEEAAILTAVSWASGRQFSVAQLHDLIISLSDFEQQQWGFYQDTSAADTAWLMSQRFGIKSNLQYDVSIEDLRNVLLKGHIAIVPVNGQKLDNPHYGQPGPARHMVVVIGYIPETNQFILNDPGTRFGEHFIVSAATLQNSLQDYESGNHKPVKVIRPAMIEVSKQTVLQQ